MHCNKCSFIISQTPFPIIVNSNTAVLKATADPKEMKIQVVDVDGKVLDQFSIKK